MGPQALIGMLASLLFDVLFPRLKDLLLLPRGGLLEHSFRGSSDILWIMACCGIAVVMNISTYGLLGKTSPVTYQVLGQLKTCLIVGLGYVFFDAKVPVNWLIIRFTGVAIAVVGILSYAVCKNTEQKRKD